MSNPRPRTPDPESQTSNSESFRWDVYLQMNEIQDDKIHWFSIINSLVIVVFLTGIVGIIMTRILRKDFARYNEVALRFVQTPNPKL